MRKHILFNVAEYIRLSREDGDKAESDSIGNQRKLITDYLKDKDDFVLYDTYIDDTAIIGLNQKTLNLRGLPIKSYFFTLFTHSHLPRGEILSKKP